MRRLARLAFALGVLFAAAISASAATRRVLYVTTTAGFRHTDSIETSIGVMQEIARETGVLEIVHTEDLSLISAANLRGFDAVWFFTSGELPLSDTQKADLLDFVRQGKGFGGSHSATDCLYSWPEYGELIGGYFDGHPWAQEAAIDVEDPQNPFVAHLSPSFRFTEEFYQFREFSRDRVRVLLTLDTRSVDMSAPGINRTDGDFPLAWMRNYGKGRVFYSAFGHFSSSFMLPPVRTMLLKARLWLTGEIEADATPRSGPSAAAPALPPDGVRNLAGPNDAFAPGSIVSIGGDRLTSGSSLTAAALPLPVRLAGTHVEVNGLTAPLFSAAPSKLLVQLPANLKPGEPASLTVSSVNRVSNGLPLLIEPVVPVIVAAARVTGAVVLYLTGLGSAAPAVRAGGEPAFVFYAGPAPGLAGLMQVNVIPASGPDVNGALELVVEAVGRTSNTYLLEK